MAIIILVLIRIIIFIIVTKIMRKSLFYNIPGYKHDNCNNIVSNSLLTDLPLGNEILSFGG